MMQLIVQQRSVCRVIIGEPTLKGETKCFSVQDVYA
jgi:hypothetical protein